MVEDERLRMKRKDIDRANEEFSDFSLSSPARKIRRLDVDLPPITEESEIDMAMQETAAEEEEEEEDDRSSPVNEERAIVLFKPPQYHQSPYGHVFVDTDFISGFKNRFLRDASRADNDNKKEDETSKNCSQALVCWNPYSHSAEAFQQRRQLEITELDESGEDAVMDDAAMDIEDDNTSTRVCFPQQEEPTTYGLHQWQQQQQQQQQQQHCMIPQLPQVSTTPITWFR